MKAKKIIKWSIFAIFLSFILVWGGSLIKDGILTELYGDKLANLNFYEGEEVFPYTWMRIIDYSETEIEVYFVRDFGEGASIGGIGKYRCNPYGDWFYSESVSWSTHGTADTLIWPYWYHVFYYFFP